MAALTSLNVSIVGAGIAGLSAAIALKRAGHRVKVGTSLLIRLLTTTVWLISREDLREVNVCR
jgi:thioredoxin reductase